MALPEDDNSGSVDGDVLLARARALAPLLRGRAGECEALRRLPEANVAELLEAGLFRIVQPRRYGGHECDLPAMLRCMIAVSAACGSTGWVLCLTAAHTWWAAQYPQAGQDELFAADGDLRFPLIFAPQGRAVPVDGGYRLSGRWNYASGCDLSNWLGVNAIVPADCTNAPPADLVVCMVAMDDVTIHDNWHVMGLRGTGSKQAAVDDLFVPARRALSLNAMERDGPPGAAVHANPFYRGPPLAFLSAELGAVAVGIARGALDAFAERAQSKQSAFAPGQTLSAVPAVQRRLAEATALTDAAESGLMAMAETFMKLCADRVARGERIAPAQRARMQLQAQQAVAAAAQAVDLLFVGAGTSAMASGETLERCFRDINALRTHYILDPERLRENWGRLAFGFEALQRTPGL